MREYRNVKIKSAVEEEQPVEEVEETVETVEVETEEAVVEE